MRKLSTIIKNHNHFDYIIPILWILSILQQTYPKSTCLHIIDSETINYSVTIAKQFHGNHPCARLDVNITCRYFELPEI